MRRSGTAARGLIVLGFVLGFACGDDDPSPPVVHWYAASSLSPLVTDIADRFERATGIVVETTVGSSSVLARQIDAGAEADVFVSADVRWTDVIADVGVRPWIRNPLVIVESMTDEPHGSLPDLLVGERVSLGNPTHVPIGMAAESWLRELGWWEEWSTSMIYAPNARAALGYVESGAAAIGVSSRAEARASGRVREVSVDGDAPALQYEVASLRSARGATDRFVAFLFGAVVESLAVSSGYEWGGGAP